MIVKALIELGYESCSWNVTNEEVYENLNWLDKNVEKPSREVINNKIAELQAEYDANEYQRQRAAEYPSWQDQLDKIYHEGIDVWKAEIKVIKDKYPKS